MAARKIQRSKVRIGFLRSAHAQFIGLSDRERAGLLSKLGALAWNPQLGKPLVGDLKGCVRVSLGRLRCVVKCAAGTAVVLVLVIATRAQGSRNDPYELAKRALDKPTEDIERALQSHLTAHLESLRTAEAEMRRDR